MNPNIDIIRHLSENASQRVKNRLYLLKNLPTIDESLIKNIRGLGRKSVYEILDLIKDFKSHDFNEKQIDNKLENDFHEFLKLNASTRTENRIKELSTLSIIDYKNLCRTQGLGSNSINEILTQLLIIRQ